MTENMKKSLKIASIFVSEGLFCSFLVFFLLFGKGLQILMPFILFGIFFTVFLFFEKIPFIRKHLILKLIIVFVLIAVSIMML